METNLTRFRNVGLVAAGVGLLPIFAIAQDATVPLAPAASTALSSGVTSSGVTSPYPSPNDTPPAPQNLPGGSDGFLSRLRAEDVLKYDWGKLQIKPHFSSTIFVTDNFQYRESKYAASDEIVSISPGFQVLYGSQDYNHVLFDYSHDQVLYLSHANFDTSQDHLKLSDQITYNRWALTGTDQIDFLSSFVGVANLQRTILINRQQWVDDYRLVLDASTRFRPYVEAYHSELKYDPNSGFYSDQLLRGKLGTSYTLTSRVNLFYDLYYGQESPSKTASFQAPVFYNTILGTSVGATGEFTTRLNGTIRFGYENRSVPNNPLVHDRGSPTVELDLTYVPSYYNQVVLSVARYTFVSTTSPTTSVGNRLNLTGTQYLTSDLKWAVQLTAGATLTDYTDTVVGPLLVPFPIHTPSGDGTVSLFSIAHTGRNDQVYDLGLNLNYAPNRWLKVTVGIAFEDYSLSYRDRVYTLFNDSQTVGLKPYQAKSVLMQFSIGF